MGTSSFAVLGIAGSLRQESYNRTLLRAARDMAPETLSITIFDLDDVPLYNADVEAEGLPKAVSDLSAALRASDGLLIATPEYNHGVPAVTKNAIDWLSRPPREAPIGGVPTAIMGASPGSTGTARAQSQLRPSLDAVNALCMPQPQMLVARAHEKIDDGTLTDESTRDYLVRFLNAFSDWIARVQ